jgi:uncharacterized protein YkuJ
MCHISSNINGNETKEENAFDDIALVTRDIFERMRI